MPGEEVGEFVSAFPELVFEQWRQRGPGGQALVDAVDLVGPGGDVVAGEGDVSALEGAAGS